MPKITAGGGPSYAELDGPADPGPDEGGEQTSPGTSSSTSREKPKTPDETSEAGRPRPAPVTANRSAKDRTDSSTARSTGGGRKAT